MAETIFHIFINSIDLETCMMHALSCLHYNWPSKTSFLYVQTLSEQAFGAKSKRMNLKEIMFGTTSAIGKWSYCVWAQGNTNHVLFMHGKVTRPGLKALPRRSTWVGVVSLHFSIYMIWLHWREIELYLAAGLPRVFNRHIVSLSYISWIISCQVLAKMLLKTSCDRRCCASLPLVGLHMSTSSLLFISVVYEYLSGRYRSG